MKEIRDIIAAYESSISAGEDLALATVVNTVGSSYRRIGARMLIFGDGHWVGGISGGCLEDDVLRKAKLALFENATQFVRYDTSGEKGQGIGVGLGCNGIIDIVISPVNPTNPHNPIRCIKECLNVRNYHFLMTVVNTGNRIDLQAGSTYNLPKPEELSICLPGIAAEKEFVLEYTRLTEQKASKFCTFSENFQVLLEYFPPRMHLIICGGNYDVIPLLKIARLIGWKVTVIANPDRVHHNIPALADVFLHQDREKLHIDDHTAILLMAHDFKTDKTNLGKYFASPSPYIGLLGPRNRTERIARELGIMVGTTRNSLPAQIFGPTGIDIGADSPEEIALSIIAEIKTVLSGRTASHLRKHIYPIHQRLE